MKLPPLEHVYAATSTSLPRHRKKSSRRCTNTTNRKCSTSQRSCPSCIGHRPEGDGAVLALIPTGNGLRPSFAQPVGEVVHFFITGNGNGFAKSMLLACPV